MASQPDAQEPGKPAADLSETLSQMIMGFRVTQIIYVAAKLSIPDLLKSGPQSVEALAQATGHPCAFPLPPIARPGRQWDIR